MLGELLLSNTQNVALTVEDDGAGTGGSLIQCDDV